MPHATAGAKPRTTARAVDATVHRSLSTDLLISIGGYRIASVSARSLTHPTLAAARVLIAVGRALEEDCLTNPGGVR